MLEFWQVFFDVFVLFALAFPLGYLLLNLIENQEFCSLSFFVRIPVYLAVGLGGLVVFFSLVGYLLINLYVIMVFLGFFWFLFFFTQRARIGLRQLNLYESMRRLAYSVKPNSIIPLLLFLFSLIHFARIAYMMGGWAPPGDSVWHGLRVSIIKNYQTLALENIASPWDVVFSSYYPSGFYVLGVAVSFLTGKAPGEAILILATGIAVLIPSMLYSMVYTKTRSHFSSLVAFLMAYIAPAFNPLPMRSFSLFAGYLQGVYTSFFGVLLTITFFYIIVCFDDFPKNSMLKSRKYLTVILVLGLAVFLTYYSFVLFVILYLAVRVFFLLRPTLRRIFVSRKILSFVGLVLLASILVILFSRFSFLYWQFRSDILSYTWAERWLDGFWVPSAFLYTNVNGFLILLSLVLVPIFVMKRQHQSMILLFLCYAVPFLISMEHELYTNYLWMISPLRISITLEALSYIVLCVLMSFILVNLMQNAPDITRSNSWKLRKRRLLRAIVACLVIALLIPLVYPSFVFQPSRWGRPTGDDYNALVWIDRNVPFGDLVLNDISMIGLYLPSFSLKNVTFLPERDWPPSILDRMLDLFPIFDHPENVSYIERIFKKHNVKYIFISSSNVYYDFWHGYEWSPPMRYRKSTEEIIRYFDSYDNLLSTAFEDENMSVRVYRVK